MFTKQLNLEIPKPLLIPRTPEILEFRHESPLFISIASPTNNGGCRRRPTLTTRPSGFSLKPAKSTDKLGPMTIFSKPKSTLRKNVLFDRLSIRASSSITNVKTSKTGGKRARDRDSPTLRSFYIGGLWGSWLTENLLRSCTAGRQKLAADFLFYWRTMQNGVWPGGVTGRQYGRVRVRVT